MDEKDTGRLEAFSDGVFAVAITLLVLNIKIPEANQADKDVWNTFFSQWPTLIAYITSFATVGIMWLNHHRLFQHIQRTDTPLLLFNLLLLLIVVFVPVPTSLLAEYLPHPQQNAAALIYSGTNLVMALCFNLLWQYASYRGRLLGKNVDMHSALAISRQYMFGPFLYLIALGLAWLYAPACIVFSFILALFFAIPGRPLRSLPENIEKEIRETRSKG